MRRTGDQQRLPLHTDCKLTKEINQRCLFTVSVCRAAVDFDQFSQHIACATQGINSVCLDSSTDFASVASDVMESGSRLTDDGLPDDDTDKLVKFVADAAPIDKPASTWPVLEVRPEEQALLDLAQMRKRIRQEEAEKRIRSRLLSTKLRRQKEKEKELARKQQERMERNSATKARQEKKKLEKQKWKEECHRAMDEKTTAQGALKRKRIDDGVTAGDGQVKKKSKQCAECVQKEAIITALTKSLVEAQNETKKATDAKVHVMEIAKRYERKYEEMVSQCKLAKQHGKEDAALERDRAMRLDFDRLKMMQKQRNKVYAFCKKLQTEVPTELFEFKAQHFPLIPLDMASCATKNEQKLF